ncbi:hypothetical protein [Paraburkholderia sp. BL25I1N1]|uniref:hypothetical protein n=1 Tax=Paraburkholderia sp. BL25I1N1 TaxID=1938804 RepID=UPI000D07EEB0|nr:hypothetical protein [Paraburkholderia sp. BL25I1N1]PRX95868.1 hypothetical protein B0G73_13276 [Paraburkholderia sp. BL25I1N1]
MIAEITTALSGVNTAIQIAKVAIGVQQDVAIKLEINKMLDAVLEAKTGLLAASERIAALQEELRQANAKLAAEAELSSYAYVQLETGAQVVTRHAGGNGLQYCPTCFGSKQLRVLQTEHDDSYLRCYICNGVFKRDFRDDQAIERSLNSRERY